MKSLFTVAAAIGITVTSASAFAQGSRAYQPPPARVHRAAAGALLPPAASPVAAVAQLLRDLGRDEATVRSIVQSARLQAPRGGARVRFEQRVAGVPVYQTYGKAAFNAQGELVHLVENFVNVPRGGIGRAAIDARAALRAALRRLHPQAGVPQVAGRDADGVIFVRTPLFAEPPRVDRVAAAFPDGSLRAAFLVETWTADNQLDHTLVSGTGEVLFVEHRTNTDSYNVFTVDPEKTGQTIVTNPADPASSPEGWLGSGPQSTINIAGNNAHAYLDAIEDDAPDPGGSAVAGGNFLTEWNEASGPSESGNRAVAVQNLFYLNNRIHDILYRAGFTESAGNFQLDNFGNGGRGGDSVNAEAQDGGGLDNANFATPRDGRSPRMQMFLWNPSPSHFVDLGRRSSFPASAAEFGAQIPPAGDPVVGDLAPAEDGTGTVTDACEPIVTDLTGKIALVDRGTCDFVVKVKNAQNAGAIATIVANNAGDGLITMGGSDDTITIPALFVGQSDGATLRSNAGSTVTLRASDELRRDGDLDSDVVFHEYGHGLTWRMIGRMDGPLAGAIGEGMSDVLSIILNDDPVVGEYSSSLPNGLRRASYEGYSVITYGDIVGAEVHADGELYGAIGWDLWKAMQARGLTAAGVLSLLVDGMNFTPAQPTFEEMRDGILQAASPADQCDVWRAFAKHGVGVGARARVRGPSVSVTESFAVPASCGGNLVSQTEN